VGTDKTDLNGNFDMRLQFGPQSAAGRPAGPGGVVAAAVAPTGPVRVIQAIYIYCYSGTTWIETRIYERTDVLAVDSAQKPRTKHIPQAASRPPYKEENSFAKFRHEGVERMAAGSSKQSVDEASIPIEGFVREAPFFRLPNLPNDRPRERSPERGKNYQSFEPRG
jgi:hypothetical protein